MLGVKLECSEKGNEGRGRGFSGYSCLGREETFGEAAKIRQADEIKPNELLNLF